MTARKETSVSRLEIRRTAALSGLILYDFFVDGEYFPEKAGIGRRDKNPAFSEFDLDIPAAAPPLPTDADPVSRAVSAYLGARPPQNQFGSGRVVLYRCHCGCDYCGVLSFSLEKADGLVRWRDIRHEDGTDSGSAAPLTADCVFAWPEYEAVFRSYLTETRRTGEMSDG